MAQRLDQAYAYRQEHGLLPDGVYLELPEEMHHADPALGSSDHKGLLKPVQWWFKRNVAFREAIGLGDNPDKPEETVFQAFGNAVDCLLTTPDQFDSRYVGEVEPPERTLFTREQYREALGSRCSLPRNATLLDYEMEAKRHDLVADGFHLGCDWEHDKLEIIAGRTVLSKRWIALLGLIDRISRIPRDDYDSKSIRDALLTDGYAQVTVIWTDEYGTRHKLRYDYLRISAIFDVKTYSCRPDQDVQDAFWQAVASWAYDLQAAHYMDGWPHMGPLISNGSVFTATGEADDAWLERLRRRIESGKPPAWTWIGVSWAGMPEIDEFRFPLHETIMESARVQMGEARKNFREYSARFPDGEPWVALRGPITMADVTAPNRTRILERGMERWKYA